MVEWTKEKINRLKTNPNNPRLIKDDKFHKLVKSIQDFPEMLEIRPIVVNSEMIVLGGNMRLKAAKEAGLKEVPIIKAENLTIEQQNEFIIKDNVSGGEWDFDVLANEWDVEQLEAWGLDIPNWANGLDDNNENQSDEQVKAIEKLEDKFIVPPFSVLNAREGKWQERKKAWRKLILDTGEARDHVQAFNNNNWEGKEYGGEGLNNVSILDPVLSEIIIKWFGLEKSHIFDCFAGDTVFGYVSSYLNNNFTGIELRKEQCDYNNKNGLNAKYICDDGRNILTHIDEKTQDLLFSCPPYFNLEVYSDLSNDASNQKEYKDFLNILDVAFSNAIKCLKDNRFAVIVCGDIRDKKGNYYRFPDHIKEIFERNNMPLYNELILIDPVGNLQMRVGKYMEHRKVGKTHQNVLVFFKGNPKEIKNIFPKIEIQIDESTDV